MELSAAGLGVSVRRNGLHRADPADLQTANGQRYRLSFVDGSRDKATSFRTLFIQLLRAHGLHAGGFDGGPIVRHENQHVSDAGRRGDRQDGLVIHGGNVVLKFVSILAGNQGLFAEEFAIGDENRRAVQCPADFQVS